VIINCRLADPSAPERPGVIYSIGPNRPEALEVISDRLAAMKIESPKIKVVVRADSRLPYEDVRAVMRVVAQRGIEMLNVVARVAEDEGSG
jgi:biopolymer transport protein ExbD